MFIKSKIRPVLLTNEYLPPYAYLQNEQILWVTGIRPGYADNLAMIQLALFAVTGQFCVKLDTGAHQILSDGARDPKCPQETKVTVSCEFGFYDCLLQHFNQGYTHMNEKNAVT